MSLRLDRRHVWFLLFALLATFMLRSTLRELTALASGDEKYTHVVFIPLIAGILVFIERRHIFARIHSSPRLGSILIFCAAAIALFLNSTAPPSNLPGLLSLRAAALILVWTSAFLLFYGAHATRAALFPLCLLLAVIPVPASWMEQASIILQKGSAEVSHQLFRLAHVPVYREGMRFSLPGLTIEVAEECSGIRSSIGLLLTSLIAGHLLLRSGSAKVVLVILSVPITILKNAVRIVALSVLGTYVSREFITGDLHHRGGPIFSLLSFGMLALVLLVLIRREKQTPRPSPADGDFQTPKQTPPIPDSGN